MCSALTMDDVTCQTSIKRNTPLLLSDVRRHCAGVATCRDIRSGDYEGHECVPSLTPEEERQAAELLTRAISTCPNKGVVQQQFRKCFDCGEAPQQALIQTEVLTLSDAEQLCLLATARISSSIEIGPAQVLAIKAGLAIPWNKNKLRLLRLYDTINSCSKDKVAHFLNENERRYAKELLSPVVFTMRRPKSVKNDMERGTQTPIVSKSTGVKEWYAWEDAYHLLDRDQLALAEKEHWQRVIKHGMAEVTTSTKTKTEPVRTKRVHICSTVITKVRDAKWGSQTKTNGYAKSVIIHAKTQGSNR
eukprot:Em0002g1618a